MSNQYPTHTERNHRRANDFTQRKQQPAITQVQMDPYEALASVLEDADGDKFAKVTDWKAPDGSEGWSLKGGEKGRGKEIVAGAVASFATAMNIACIARDNGYSIVNPDALTSANYY